MYKIYMEIKEYNRRKPMPLPIRMPICTDGAIENAPIGTNTYHMMTKWINDGLESVLPSPFYDSITVLLPVFSSDDRRLAIFSAPCDSRMLSSVLVPSAIMEDEIRGIIQSIPSRQDG